MSVLDWIIGGFAIIGALLVVVVLISLGSLVWNVLR